MLVCVHSNHFVSCALTDYRTNAPYIGCTVGRVANRIKDSQFVLDGKTYHLTCNDHSNHLHGGNVGFHKVQYSTHERDIIIPWSEVPLY